MCRVPFDYARMDETTARAMLVHLTAQTELFGVLARYYAGLSDSNLVKALPDRTLDELREVSPEAAALAERMSERRYDERVVGAGS